MADYTQDAIDIIEDLKEDGQSVTIEVITKGVSNDDTSTTATTTATTTAYGVVFDLSVNQGEKYFSNEGIKTTDRILFLDSSTNLIDKYKIKLTVSGIKYTASRIQSVSPDGTVLLYIILISK